jgi:hypothetical protein
MRQILLSSLLLIGSVAAGCGAEPEVIVTPPTAAAKASPDDVAKQEQEEAAAKQQQEEAAAKGAPTAGTQLVHCIPNAPGPGCEPPPTPGRIE